MVQAHGVDWLGFREIRASYAALYSPDYPPPPPRPPQPRNPRGNDDDDVAAVKTYASITTSGAAATCAASTAPKPTTSYVGSAPKRTAGAAAAVKGGGGGGTAPELTATTPMPGERAMSWPRMVSIELRCKETGEIASAELGYIVGQCYTCISLFEVQDRQGFERCGRVRAAAAAELLVRAGVQLIDVGTTAGYYAKQFGYATAFAFHF